MDPGRAASDADLVAAAVAGDRDAFAAIYDRYADRIYSTCARLLRNRDDAADACADVFLLAAERLDQLRDPTKLRPWLFAIARRQVYLRTGRRSRTVPVEEVDDVSAAGPAVDPAPVETAVEGAELATLVREAASGLDDGDRLVLELQLQGLDGADLADALGVSANNAYQAAHRMKERLERSLGALLVARRGRADCADLDRLLGDWDGRFSVLWRKRVARHVDRCEVCERRRKAVPALLLEGVAAATPVLAVPVSVRDRVLSGARIGGASGRPWPGDGFPPPDRSGPRRTVLAVAAVLVLALLGGLGLALVGEDETVLADGPTGTSDPRPSTTSSTTTTTVPVTPAAPGPAPVPPPPEAAPTTTTTPAPTGPAPTTTVAPAPPTVTVPPTTAPADTQAPVVRLSGPATRPCGGATQPFTAVVADQSPVSSVVLQWVTGTGATGSQAMTASGSGWTATYRPTRWDGPYTFRAVATDAAGNVGTSAALTCGA